MNKGELASPLAVNSRFLVMRNFSKTDKWLKCESHNPGSNCWHLDSEPGPGSRRFFDNASLQDFGHFLFYSLLAFSGGYIRAFVQYHARWYFDGLLQQQLSNANVGAQLWWWLTLEGFPSVRVCKLDEMSRVVQAHGAMFPDPFHSVGLNFPDVHLNAEDLVFSQLLGNTRHPCEFAKPLKVFREHKWLKKSHNLSQIIWIIQNVENWCKEVVCLDRPRDFGCLQAGRALGEGAERARGPSLPPSCCLAVLSYPITAVYPVPHVYSARRLLWPSK